MTGSAGAGTAPARTSRLGEDEVRERLAWAVRQGTPLWPWPDHSPEQWEGALAEIARATRGVLGGGRPGDMLRGDPEHVGLAGYTSGLGPLLGHWISRGALLAPPATSALLELHYRHNRLRMRRLARAATRVVSRLLGQDIRVTVLKGMHTAFTCFPAPGTRPMSDVDLMIDPADKPAAGQALRELGFVLECERSLPDEQSWRSGSARPTAQSLSFVHWDDPWTIDLHSSANRRPCAGGPILAFDDIVRAAQPCRWPLHPGAQVLPPAASLLFLASHAGYQLHNLRMLRLVELVFAIRHARASGGLRWDQLVELGAASGTLPCAFPALKLADALAPGSVPEAVLSACEQSAPGALVRLVARLRPETAQRLIHCSIEERYAWASTWRGRARQFVHDLLPFDEPLRSMASTMRTRFWRVARGRVSIAAPAARAEVSEPPR